MTKQVEFPTGAQREAWLAGLKPNDKVCVHTDTRGNVRFTLGVVERITPTGAFRVREKGADSLSSFAKDGEANRGGTWGWWERMQPWTPEVDAYIAREKLVNSVLFYINRSVIDREMLEAASDEDLKKLVMALRLFRKKNA